MGAALTAGIVTPQTQFRIPYAIKVGDRIVHDDAVRPTRTFTAAQILQQSSNVGTVTIAELVHKQPLYDWIRRWGFGRPTHIGLPAEARARRHAARQVVLLLDRQHPDRPGHLGHAAADGGHVLGHRQRRRDGRAARGGEDRRPPAPQAGLAADPEPDRRPHPGEHAEGRRRHRRRHRHPRVGAGLHRGRQDRHRAEGAAHSLGYSTRNYVASFVGFLPADNPRVEVLVVVDSPRTNIFGGIVAAPPSSRSPRS